MKNILFILFPLLLFQISCKNKISLSEKQWQNNNLHELNPEVIEQQNFSAIEIETKINTSIQTQINNGALVSNMKVPFNEKTLHYLGCIHPNTLKLFSKNQITNQKAPELNKKLHVYKYDYFYISTETNDTVSQQNVYYALRAINILKYRYPQAYNRLIKNTMFGPKPMPSAGFNYLNTNQAIWIGFNKNPGAIASNRLYLILDGYADTHKTIDLYRNIAIVNIDSENILGHLNLGSKPIYGNSTANKNRMDYLKEGLVESILHEMLHNYIDYAHSALPEYNALYKMRGKTSFNNFEEILVLNTSLSYLYREGGFTNKIKDYYYQNTFDANISNLKYSGLFETYFKNVFNKQPYNLREDLKLSLLN